MNFDIQGLAVGALAGILVGAIIAALISRSSAKRLAEELRSRVSTAEANAQTLQVKLDDAQSGRSAEAAAKAAAEARAYQLESEKQMTGQRVAALDAKVQELQDQTRDLESQRSAAVAAIKEKDDAMARFREEMEGKFKELSGDVLAKVSEQFLLSADARFKQSQEASNQELDARTKMIRQSLEPFKEKLDELEQRNRELETTRATATGELKEQITSVFNSAQYLSNALRKPQIRGSWGEASMITLLENAGLMQGEQFTVQEHRETDGGALRTDVVVKLPGGRRIVIDSKAVWDSFVEGCNEANEEKRAELFKKHASQVRTHAMKLSGKEYGKQFDGVPDATILYLPSEGMFVAAVDADPKLIGDLRDRGVYLANPATLLYMAQLAGTVLTDARVRESAAEIQNAGRDLYDRFCVFMDHFAKVGRGLKGAVEAFNDATASSETRLQPAARKIIELGVPSSKELPEANGIDVAIREQQRTRSREIPESMTNGD